MANFFGQPGKLQLSSDGISLVTVPPPWGGTDGWTDRRKDGWTGRRSEGWMDRGVQTYVANFFGHPGKLQLSSDGISYVTVPPPGGGSSL